MPTHYWLRMPIAAGPVAVHSAGGNWDEALLSFRFSAAALAGTDRGHRAHGLPAAQPRWQTGQQLIQTNGVTYNVYGDPQGKERPWPMDPIPLVIAAAEWAHIERSITQRATLLNSMLGDLYGQQETDGGTSPSARDAVRHPAFSARLASASFRPAASTCTPTRPIWRVRRMATGG